MTNHPDYSLVYPSRDGTGMPAVHVHPTTKDKQEINMNTQPRNITEPWLQSWINTNRPDLGLLETNGVKGFYKLSAGPAHSFMGIGKTWKQVAAHLEAIQLPDNA